MDINKHLAANPSGWGGNPARGASMGRDSYADRENMPAKVYLQRVDFVDQCYDRGGAYWGGPADLYCAKDDADTFQWFIRAPDRAAAKVALREEFPELKFY